MTDQRYRPVVALDMDGVIRALTNLPSEQLVAHTITMTRDNYPHGFMHGEPEWDDDGLSTEVEYFSRVGVEWVRDLVRRGVDVRWATTWQEFANVYFSPVLGLPDLPVAVGVPGKRSLSPGGWKAWQLAQRFDGRPLVLVDDEPGEGRRCLMAGRRPADRPLTRIHRVTTFLTGLRAPDVAALETWLTLASAPEGHRTLRAQHLAELEEQQRAAGGMLTPAQAELHAALRGLFGTSTAAIWPLIDLVDEDRVSEATAHAVLDDWGPEVAPRAADFVTVLREHQPTRDAPAAPSPGNAWAEIVGPAYSTASFAKALHTTPNDVLSDADDLRILRVYAADGVPVYPAFQVSNGIVAPGLQQVLRTLQSGSADPWMWALWLNAEPTITKTGDARETHIDRLHAGHLNEVLLAANRTAAAWSA
ncbi:hypothetical protein BOH66_01160 [Microbacterium aurum]|uniref:Uncharacterized protein n=1 Tax=Microbacterium aurum TaxID=36805 RepID=A0A1P8U4M6_9MICO|nr:hypothetical protein [Microbacterium aurum]APZ33060.1 hypothetical protein BOH66_01160 [Microbacterium aurum]MBM7826616.1 hypothetical protein [Microbacterium aurum]